jgi:hypothetical protein
MYRALALALIVSACNAEPATPTSVYDFQAVGFTADELVVLQTASDQWCERSAGTLCANISANPAQSKIVLVASLPGATEAGEVRNMPHCSEHDARWLGTEGVTINVRDWRNVTNYTWPDLLGMVTLHELGHVFGKEHSTNPADVMYPDGTTPLNLTTADLSGACPWRL